VTIIKIDGLI